MVKQQDVIDKANEDFVKFKARLLYLGREKIFQQSEKIEFARRLKSEFDYPFQIMDNNTIRAILDMDNIYDVFYRYYKAHQPELDIAAHINSKELVDGAIFDYRAKYMV